MYVVLRDANGETLDGMVLAIGRDRMRVALRGGPDVVELQRSYTRWVDDDTGEVIEFDALLSDGDSEGLFAEMFPMTSAGHA